MVVLIERAVLQANGDGVVQRIALIIMAELCDGLVVALVIVELAEACHLNEGQIAIYISEHDGAFSIVFLITTV